MSRFANQLAQAKQQLSKYTFVELVYQGSRTIVYRAVESVTQQPVVIKILAQEYPSFRELVQFRNQYMVAKNLPIEGFIRHLQLLYCGNSYALVMEDFGGISLSQYYQNHSLTIREILDIAIQLADICHELYQHRVIHKDIKPANILIHPESKQVRLIDFSLASLLPKETQVLQSPKHLEGTLAYLAPEQTGRMNRGLDYRADFYALGVTLYQLLTGRLPFTSEDPLELLHSHIAQIPVSVNEVNPSVPMMVAAIVAKLMAKNAEDRYQSAIILKHDLELCLVQWQETGTVVEFGLGQRDLSDRFLIPEKLYGRETEVHTLLTAFDRVSQGTSELMLVAGYSGVGKTAVVNEVHKPIARQRGYFIKGKFDQFNRSIPFSAFVQAFRDLVGQLLSESDTQLQTWKTQILEALGENAQVIVELIPALERIIGAQSSAPELSGTAAQNRFNILFQRFIQVFTTAEHPLVIFVDDLQWADSASLNLIHLLMADVQTGYLLLLGAYRDNEVSPAHPLMLSLDEMQKVEVPIHTITLQPLSFASLNHLIADTLHVAESLAHPLSDLVMQKTQGNPFFATQFLKTLYQEQLITFDHDADHWQCDMAKVRESALTDDVVEFMALQLQKLPESTKEMLKLAACIGAQFDLTTLAIVAEQSQTEVATSLWQALQDGLILPQSILYKFYLGGLGESEAQQLEPTEILHYRFLHDRVQQAAYNLIAEHDKSKFHLKIGRLLLQQTTEEDRDLQLFVLTSQFNHGRHLIETETERQTVLVLNMQAGEKSRKSVAYGAAIKYFEIAWSLLPDVPWGDDSDRRLDLAIARMEVAYLNGDYEQSWTIGEQTLANVSSPLERAKILEVQVLIEIARGRMLEAVELGCGILESLGVEILDAKTAEEEIVLPKQEELEAIATMSDPLILRSMSVLMTIIPPVFIATNLFPQVVVTMLKLSLAYGNSKLSPYAYAAYGWLVTGAQGKILLGYRAGELSLYLKEKLNTPTLRTKLGVLYNAHILAYREPLRNTLNPLRELMYSGLDTGDLEYASYAAMHYCHYPIWAGEKLDTVAQEQERAIAFIDRYLKQSFSREFACVWRQMVYNLRQPFTDQVFYLRGAYFNEEESQPELEAGNVHNTLVCFYLAKSFINYLFGRYEQSAGFAAQCGQHTFAIPGVFTIPMHNFVQSLAELAQYPSHAQSDLTTVLDLVDRNQAWLKVRVDAAPVTFQHKYDLVEAERHRILSKRYQAMELYDLAIAGARNNGYIQEEAIANELAAKFYLDSGKEKIAASYMQEAYYCYYRWGAKAKTDDLEQRYPELLGSILQPSAVSGEVLNMLMAVAAPTISEHSSTGKNYSILNQSIDFASILKASQALSSTIHLDELLHQLTQIILQNSGGDRCALVLPNLSKEWQVRAIATPNSIALGNTLLEKDHNLPVKLIQYVKNTQEVLVIDNLNTDLPIIDPYLEQQRPQSILCLPLLHQGQVVGIMYVSNRSTQGVFTKDRILILNFLCTQAAISLENARLYQQSQGYAEQLEQSLVELKQLEAEQQRLIDVLETTPDYIGVANAKGEIIWHNKPLRTLRHDLTVHKDISECHPNWANEIILNQALPTAIAQGSWTGELALLDNKGQEIPVSQVIIAHKNAAGEVKHFSTIMRDISELKKAEKSLKLTQFAVNKTAMGIFWIREDGSFWDTNEAACSSLGYGQNELQGRYIWDIDAYLQPQEWSRYWQDLTQKKYVRFETYHQHKDGKIFPVEITSNYLESEGQGFAFSQAQDISDRKNHEEYLERTNAELIRATRLKDEFLATMSHELRTPLNAILGMTEGLQEEIFGDINPKQLKALNTINQSGTHLLTLINDILDLSKITADKLELTLVPTNIVQLCYASLQMLQPQAQKKRIQFQTSLLNQLPSLLMDTNRIKQVLINLLSNAVKFTPDGGQVSLCIDGQSLPDPTMNCPQGFLRITIKDTGIGILPENLDKIFQPFTQIDSALNRRYEGTGLGLALVKKIVELHKGFVQVNSEVGAGSSFIINLPWLTETPSSVEELHSQSDQTDQLSAPLILLVEDDAANVMTISTYLEAKGYRVAFAENGQEAIALVQSLRPNVILMDIQMPIMDGIEATKRIRQDLGIGDIPIIALTALAMKDDHERCLKAGADEYLSKPVRLSLLTEMIQKYV
ncbi:MAG: AAA family ATPase [Pseudanabaena sp.]|jgi:PAS domain S-box-containing protein